MRRLLFLLFASLLLSSIPPWAFGVKIATAYDLPLPWEEVVKRAVKDGATVILDWSRLGNSWKCLYEPCLSTELERIKRRAEFVHSRFPGVKLIYYVAPMEYVTPDLDLDGDGKVDPQRRALSLYLNHPSWVQTGISGRKAVFFGSMEDMPFWVCPTCEDVWLTPANSRMRELHLVQAKKIALSGADGIWLDVPFLRGDFGGGWEGQWPDVGKEARELFHKQTGKTLPSPPFQPDWENDSWLEYVSWRYRLIREFVEEYSRAIKGENPDFLLAVETSVDYSVFCTQTGSDPRDMARTGDLVAHEIGGVEESAQKYSWLSFLARLKTWRDMDALERKPSWSLSYVYSWAHDLENTVKLHAASIIFSGFSYYTSGDEGMSSIPHPALRRAVFHWLGKNRERLYQPNLFPYPQALVVHSRSTLDYISRGDWERDEYSDGFYGMVMMLLEAHLPFMVIHEENLKKPLISSVPLLILPDYAAMGEREADIIRKYVEEGGTIIATHRTSLYDERGRHRGSMALADVLGISRPSPIIHEEKYGRGRAIYSGIPFEKYFFWAASPWDPAGEEGNFEDAEGEREEFVNSVLGKIGIPEKIKIKAPSSLISLVFCSGGGLQIRFINLKGVGWGVSRPQEVEVKLDLPSKPSRVLYLPFLGVERSLPPQRKFKLRVNFGGVLSLDGISLPLCNKFLPFFKRKF